MADLESIRALIAAGNRDEAMRQLARVLSTDPGDIHAWLLMAQVIEDPARKADCYRQVLKIDPQNSEALQFLQPPAPSLLIQPTSPPEAAEPPASTPNPKALRTRRRKVAPAG